MTVIAEPGVAMVAVPLATLHMPDPDAGVLPVTENEPELQLLIVAGPASATVGASWLFNVMFAWLGAQGPLETVHKITGLVPAGTPVTVVFSDVVFVMVAVPLCTLHIPVPTVGAAADMLNVPVLHCERLVPEVIFAVLGRS